MSPHGKAEYFMKSPRLSLAHAVPRSTQEAQTVERKTHEEVDVQTSYRKELVLEILHSHVTFSCTSINPSP